eukprot:322990_1
MMATNALSVISELINNFENVKAVICICGSYLKRMDLQYMNDIDPQYICCSECLGRIKRQFWMCPQDLNITHPDGYDVCDQCFTQMHYTERTEETQIINDIWTNESHTTTTELFVDNNCKNLEECVILKDFIRFMNQYYEDSTETTKNTDKVKLLKITNHYLHLVHKHDEQFKIVFDRLTYCEISNCMIFTRNNRNRIPIKININERICDFRYDILDKMHCYFSHCYDVGNRLSIQDKRKIKYLMNEQKNDDEDPFNKCINRQYTSCYRNPKYNKLLVNKYYQSAINNEEQKDHIYHFGIAFFYGYEGESKFYGYEGEYEVAKKFDCLKEELLQNPFAMLNIDQYKNEYEKASILFNSQYRRRNIVFQSFRKGATPKLDYTIPYTFSLENLLALMIHCNYTVLQQVFSKTYRENNGNDHNNFYFWGRNLKISLHYFRHETASNVFFHGIDQVLYFQFYAGTKMQSGVKFYGPLSTSSEFAVAFNFATDKGLIIQLTGDRLTERYFPVWWLSDFGNEKEYLFIQGMPSTKIINIIEPQTGYEYNFILRTIQLVHDILNEDSSNVPVAKLKLDANICDMIKIILEDKLSETNSKYNPFKSISEFGRQILNTLFEQQTIVQIHYWRFKKHFSFLTEFVMIDDEQFEWINLDSLCLLFPNLTFVAVSHIKLCLLVFEDILNHFHGGKTQNNLKSVQISRHNINSSLSVEDVIVKYSSQFRAIGAFISSQIPHNEACTVITIELCDSVSFVTRIIGKMYDLLFGSQQ